MSQNESDEKSKQQGATVTDLHHLGQQPQQPKIKPPEFLTVSRDGVSYFVLAPVRMFGVANGEVQFQQLHMNCENGKIAWFPLPMYQEPPKSNLILPNGKPDLRPI